MKSNFKVLGISDVLIDSLERQRITEPTDIQQKVIPEALLNFDIIAESETGTGKTLAFLLPLIEKIDPESRDVQGIILTPTHELAAQINNVIKELELKEALNIRSGLIIGNVNQKKQIEVLKKNKPQIVIGSAGRIRELIKMKKMKVHNVKIIIVDEADRLLDKNNIKLVKEIVKSTLKDRQLMFFSATIDNATIELGKEIMKDYKLMKASGKSRVNPDIEHYYFVCEERDKLLTLRKLMHIIKPKKAIAFLNIEYEINKALERLVYHKVDAVAIYGKMDKEERKKSLYDLKKERKNLLVASDLAARGLDIKNVDVIFNLDLPEDFDKYLHRVGRTGRNRTKGLAISIVTEREVGVLKKIMRKYSFDIAEKRMFEGKILDK